MWWRSALVLPLALVACGFTPVYGPDGDGLALRDSVRVEAPDTDEEFAFVGRIEDRLGRPAAPEYDMTFTLVLDEEGLAIDGSNNITRYSIEGRLVWALTRGDAPVLSGEETAFTAYAATGSTISTLEAERDARRRLMVILADRVVARLLAS